MPRLQRPALVRLGSALLERAGSEADEAGLVARHLADANLSGHDSHGVGILPDYVAHALAGTLVPNTPAELIKDEGAILLFDGRRGFGRRVGGEAMAAAIGRCAELGLVLLGLRNAHHLGRIGAFGEMAAAAGLVSLHFVNVTDHRPIVAPFGGLDARFSTNPLCIALPREAGRPPLILDMATSRIAFGKARVAAYLGRPVPEGSLIDAAGRPSTDPGVLFQDPKGALLPFGEHKGHGLAVICELLAGVLTAGGTMQPETPLRGGILNNMLAVLIDPGRLVGRDWLHRELEAFVAHVKASPPRDPAQPVLVPGESEDQARRERARSGVEIDPTTWEEILAAADRLGLTPAEVAALVV